MKSTEIRPTSKLSRLQRRILCAVLTVAAGEADKPVSYYPVRSRVWNDSEATPALRAAFGRALVRLQARGLLTLEKWIFDTYRRSRRPVKWSAQVSLTAAGAEAAKRLTVGQGEGSTVNRCSTDGEQETVVVCGKSAHDNHFTEEDEQEQCETSNEDVSKHAAASAGDAIDTVDDSKDDAERSAVLNDPCNEK